VVFLCEIPFLAVLTAIIRTVKMCVVTHHNIFVNCKSGVSQIKLGRSASPFGLASWFKLYKVKSGLLGTAKFTSRPMRIQGATQKF